MEKDIYNYATKSENCASCKRAKHGRWNKGLFFCSCSKGKHLDSNNPEHYEKCPFMKTKEGNDG